MTRQPSAPRRLRVDIQLGRLEQRLAQQQLTLNLDAASKKLLASEGYGPQFGASPPKRTVQEHLLDPPATTLLAGDLSRLGNGERNLSALRDEGR